MKSAFFTKVMQRGVGLTKNRALLLIMIQQGASKLESKGISEGVKEVKDKLKLMIRFVTAYAKGEYRDVGMKSMATIVGVLVYFVSPLDLIPDVLPILGVADDVALVVWMFNVLEKEITKFSDWEKKSKTINIG